MVCLVKVVCEIFLVPLTVHFPMVVACLLAHEYKFCSLHEPTFSPCMDQQYTPPLPEGALLPEVRPSLHACVAVLIDVSTQTLSLIHI